jgi:ABC-2 type transport system permease protein
MYPVELFPPALRAAAEWMPFRYQIGLPVEVMTGAHDLPTTLGLLARQWLWVVLSAVVAGVLWKRGLKRFSAVGG